MADLRRIRRVKTAAFTTINNTVLRDSGLSLKAKGVMVTVMGLPDDWDFSVAGLISIVKEGRTAIYSAIKELKNAGYVRVDRIYENGKIVAWEYVFSEVKQPENLFDGFQQVENQDIENLDIENRTQYKKQGIKEVSKGRNNELHMCAETKFLREAVKKIFQKHFGKPLSTSLSELVLPAVTDLAAWERTVVFWFLNSYKPNRRMLDYYREEITSDPTAAHFGAFR